MRGISSNGSYIFVGTSLGNVLVFSIEPSTKASGDVFETGFTLLHNLQTVKNPIMCTGGSLSVLASANETGCIFTFDVSGAFELLFKHEGYGFPVTCMAVLDDVIYAGFSSGHIRIYRSNIHECSVEFTAHTRALCGILLLPRSNFFVSCSEDQLMRVWSLPNFTSTTASHVDMLFTEQISNRLCTGMAAFSDSRICIASYDDDNLIVYAPEL